MSTGGRVALTLIVVLMGALAIACYFLGKAVGRVDASRDELRAALDKLDTANGRLREVASHDRKGPRAGWGR